MCGICGVLDWGTDRPVTRSLLKQMVWQIRHRGPDELGLYLDPTDAGPRAGLGHARLSIIDLSGGAQPMPNEDESLWITFNGEIFNYVELTPELERRGHRFKTRSDTEVILHLYEEYGPRCLEHMNGQFAFAIWDRRTRRAFLARDRFGVRPLYYTRTGKRMLFASEMKALFATGEIAPRLDPIGLDQAFTFWSPLAPRTAFQDVQQLPPAHYLVATEQGIQVERYWDLGFPDETEPAAKHPKQFYVERLRDELVRATRLRMRADVPVGAYLSGGLDSSLTSAIVKEYTDADLNTFSVRFQDARFDETEHQEMMVSSLGTTHHSVLVTRDDIATAFRDVVWHTETPILRTAPVPLHVLSSLVRARNVKVVVTGEGADEMLGGYDIFKEAKIRRFWARHPGSQLRPLLFSRIYPDIRASQRLSASYWQQFFGQDLTDIANPCYSHLIRWHNTATLKRFLTPALRGQIGNYDPALEFRATLPERFPNWAPLSQAQYIEIFSFMCSYLLSSQGDRVGMSHAVENRFPFLDFHVAEFAAQIPPNYKLRVLEEKHILREVARDLLPAPVRTRPKQPYRAPDSASFFSKATRDMTRETLSEDAVRDAGCFEPRMVTRLVEKCARTADGIASARDDMALVGILSAQLLHDQFVKRFPRHNQIPDAAFCVRLLSHTVEMQSPSSLEPETRNPKPDPRGGRDLEGDHQNLHPRELHVRSRPRRTR